MAIRVSEFKSARLSDDGREVVIDCAGRYTGDLELRFSRDCFDQMLRALIGAVGAGVAEPQPAAPGATESPPSSEAAPPAVPVQPPGSLPPAGSSPQAKADEIRVEIPRKIAVTTDPGGRGYVILIVNHQLENQIGYALTPDAAGNIADGLTKSAATVRAAKPGGQPTK